MVESKTNTGSTTPSYYSGPMDAREWWDVPRKTCVGYVIENHERL